MPPLRPLYSNIPTNLLAFQSKTICLSCTLSRFVQAVRYRHRARPALEGLHSSSRSQARDASSLASHTAINATKSIPPSLQALYDSLEGLKKDAPNYVNLSRLQLALRSLESSKPRIRVAILGLKKQQHARRIARLLLSDVLSPEGEWERSLERWNDDDSSGLLLRYGDEDDVTPANALVRTLHVPSRILQLHNLEFLVSSMNIASAVPHRLSDANDLRRTALVPTTETPNSFAGSVSVVTYPVHRALVVGDGLQGCLAIGRYLTERQQEQQEDRSSNSVQFVLDFSNSRKDLSDPTLPQDLSVLDVEKAQEGLAKFRESKNNATLYEELWIGSGLPKLNEWLMSGFNESQEASINSSVEALVRDLTDEAWKVILKEEEARLNELSRPNVADKVRQPLNGALEKWAMHAHTELRDELEKAFATPNWYKLQWWKLIWRSDDVSMIITELLERHWLPEAEKGIIWLSGRATEAGLVENRQPTTTIDRPAPITEGGKFNDTEKEQQRTSKNSTDQEHGVQSALPEQVAQARRELEESTIPELQALSQSLVIQTLSISTLSSVLSVLTYVSSTDSSLYTAGTLGALGFAIGLRRLQKTWEGARAEWQAEVQERGRIVLKEVEGRFRDLISHGGKETLEQDDIDVEDRIKAREAVERVRRHLSQP